MVVQEQSFPRGGKHSEDAAAPTVKLNLFSKEKKKKTTKKKSKEKTKHHVVTGSGLKLEKLEDLSYNVLSEGMSVLGQITGITDYHLHIAMPGLCVGTVPITQISEPYSELLQSMSQSDDNVELLCPLSEIFYKGQLVTAQVWQIRTTADNKHIVTLTLDPRIIHSSWSHSTIAKKGLVITAAVKSKEEHGYVMDCGVNGLRCFLKEDKARNYCDTFNGGRPLAIGQLVRCVIKKAETSPTASKVQLSADPEDVSKWEEGGSPSVDMQHILPGMRFSVTADEPLRDGIKVKFFDFSGYIHRNHLPQKFSQNDNHGPQVPPGTTLFGRVLYVTPIVKNIYLSVLSNINSVVREIPKPSPAEVHFAVGDITNNAQVTSVGGRGISLCLGEKSLDIRGFVPEKRVGFNYKGNIADDDDEVTMLERLRKKFPIGSSVRCRLIHFNIMSQTYVCSLEKSILNEKYLTLRDVHVGDVVPCVVDNIRDGGIIITVGMLTGFVPALHSADIPLKHPSKRFPPGTKVSGRVLKVDVQNHNLIVTLKQSLVTYDEPIIATYQGARKGTSYLGTVVATSSKGVYVSFFGGVRGFLRFADIENSQNQKFYLGQLLKCYVTRRSNSYLRLSMKSPTDFTSNLTAYKAALVGHCYKLEVVRVSNAGLQVKIMDEGDSFNACGVIPTLHLSDDPRMCRLLLDTFEIGTVLTNVWCYSKSIEKNSLVFSMRSSVIQFFKSIEGKIGNKKTLEAVCRGWILPCSIQKILKSHLLLSVPLAAVKGLVKVERDFVCSKGETFTSLGLVEGQGIQAKVQDVLIAKDTLALDCRKDCVWGGELESCVLHLSKYLTDQQRLLEHAKKVGDPIGSYCFGDSVSGLVVARTDWGFTFSLANGARGEATFFNSESDNLEIGSRITGKVLFVDCVRRHVEITLRKDVCSTLTSSSEIEDSPAVAPDIQLRGPTLLVTPEFVLMKLKGAGQRYLGYIPTFLYPFSNSELTVPEPFFGIDRKVIVKRCIHEIIICLPKDLIVQQRKNEKKAAKDKERKAKKAVIQKDRYFSQQLAPEEIKQEVDDSDMDDIEDVQDDEELESARRVLDPSRDVQIIDVDMDNISDEESDVPDLNDSYSDIESGNVSFEVSRKRKLSMNTESNETGDLTEIVSPKIHKRNSSNSVDLDNSVSLESNCVDENGSEERMTKRKKDRDSEILEGTTGMEMKKKKKKGEVTDAASSTNISNGSNKAESEIKPTLKNPGFLWDIDPVKFTQVLESEKNATSDKDDQDSEDEASKKKKRKKSAAERREAARLEEERLQKVERDLLDPNRQLTSCDDFDRMVLANPDSSTLWLQYMAFHLEATEIERARAVAQRAIKTISYREEQEKLNVWLALLNLENLYGTPESLRTTLDEALRSNDPFKVRAHMVRIYAESGKTKELESEVRFVVKKFKDIPGMWQEIGSILMNHGYAEKARSLMQQALPHMKNKKESVSLIVQFALMESRNNNMEQAKALMDPVLVSCPQRVDIWNTYCDMLVKAGQINEARELLERSVSQKLPARKMKSLFTKFLKFEETYGSKDGQDRVRSMASEYVKQVTGNETVEDV